MADSPTNIKVHFCPNRLTNTAKIFEAFANRTFVGGAQSPFLVEIEPEPGLIPVAALPVQTGLSELDQADGPPERPFLRRIKEEGGSGAFRCGQIYCGEESGGEKGRKGKAI